MNAEPSAFVQAEWLHMAAPVLIGAALAFCLGSLISHFIISAVGDGSEEVAAEYAAALGGQGHDA